ncbi:M10 family metallopeptidase C-terminal domain-containing protein [Algirhabdus cladophorae]|uniref:M10 family metallopeptidase C-terminal domain-containing protein n=1 Tax=Algirhabdus cladophorae TaxID=3377108 RepID=UPI003B84A118
MPTEQEILDALQFDLTLLNGPINTSNDPAYVLTYEFAGSTQPDDHVWDNYTGWTPYSAAEKATYRAALDHIETIINVQFVEYNAALHGSEPDINAGKVDLDNFTSGVGGYSYSATSSGHLVSFDGFTVFKNTLDLTSRISLILHELGHTLANKHPFSGTDVLPDAFDSNKYTVMSYDVNPDNGVDSDALQLYDLLSLQDRWGANMTTNISDTTYTQARNPTVDSIWDTGGIDTFDASAQSSAVVLNLNEGSFSSFQRVDDVSIGYGVVIENAIGGAADDTLTGNTAANELTGNAGKDLISGDKGRDIIKGGKDADKLLGERGNDTLKGGNGRDVLKGGNGRDLLEGGIGDDRLTGGALEDVFVFKSGHGRDTIQDFEDDIDTLKLGIDGITTLAQVEAVADRIDGNLVLDFGGNDRVTLKDITWDALSDDITLI